MQRRKKVFEFAFVCALGGVDCFAHHAIQAIQLVASDEVAFYTFLQSCCYQYHSSTTLSLHRTPTSLPPASARRSLNVPRVSGAYSTALQGGPGAAGMRRPACCLMDYLNRLRALYARWIDWAGAMADAKESTRRRSDEVRPKNGMTTTTAKPPRRP